LKKLCCRPAQGCRISQRSRPPTVHFQLNGFDIADGLCLAETDALRISAAKVAFERLPALFTELHDAEGAGGYAHLAADAEIVVDKDAVQLFVPVDGFPGAYRHAGWILALLAVHGKMETFLLALDHPDAGECRVADAPVSHRAYHLAFPAAVAFFGLYEELLGHRTLPLNVHYKERI
jgi:hypothetical protein